MFALAGEVGGDNMQAMPHLQSEEELAAQRIAHEIVSMLRGDCDASPVMTLAEFDAAIASAGFPCTRSSVARRWKVRHVSRGRYWRQAVIDAIERERSLHSIYVDRWKCTEMSIETDAFAARVAKLVLEGMRAPRPTELILSREEARNYVRCEREAQFSRWCRYWKIEPVGPGRYSRPSLDLALQREAGIAHTPATLKRHQQTVR